MSHLVIGPVDHGVAIFARWLAGAAGDPHLAVADIRDVDDEVVRRLTAGGTAVHLHYTEALYGRETGSAAEAFVQLRRRLPTRVSVTLHDLPDPGDEPGRYRRRAAGFRRVVEAADAVCVSSEHERTLVAALPGVGAVDVRVIPLPVRAPQLLRQAQRPAPAPEVAVFGFVYPGKGHDDVLEAMSGLPQQISLTAIGRVADGHEPMTRDLIERAASRGRSLEVTGFVPENQVLGRLRRVAVPVVPARVISASGSLNTWIGAGRRPLVADGPYAREFAGACPGTVTLYRPDELAGLIRVGLDEPDRGWLERPPPPERLEAGVAAAYRDFFADPAGAVSR